MFGLVVTVVALVAVAWPLSRDPVRGDSFPLSTYPMFASRRPGAKVGLVYVIATAADGARRHVPPYLVASAEVMQAIVTVAQAVSRGDAAGLCRRVAARVARDGGFAPFTTVQVIAGNHAAVDYLVHGKRGTERVLATCAIERGAR